MNINPQNLIVTNKDHDIEMSKEEADNLSKLAPIFDSVKNNTCGANINLECNKIGAAGAVVFGKVLKINKTLISINLRGNEIGAAGAAALAKALETNKTLTSISLGENQIGAVGAEAFAKALEINKTLISRATSL
jgi:NLR family CARD domain-containing protein 3